MNYLQICQRVSKEAGISDTGFSSVVGRDADHERIVEWVALAWLELQQLHEGWRFMWQEFELPTVAAQQDYADSDVTSPASASVAFWDEDLMRIYLQSDGKASEGKLIQKPYREFMELFATGDPEDSAPGYFTVLPNNKLRLFPTPDDVYIISGQFYSKPTVLSADGDEPDIPVEFHEILVQRALMHYAAYEEADAVLSTATGFYNQMLWRLKARELPQMSFGAEPLA